VGYFLADLDEGRTIQAEWELAIYRVVEDGVKLGTISHRRDGDCWLVVREGAETGTWVGTKAEAVALLAEVHIDERAS
jgi:hypothetical protein